MKIKVLFLVFFCISININAQTDREIASVYLKRAEESFSNFEIENSLKIFNKALKYMDSITDSRVARLGMLLHYELDNLIKAKAYSIDYFRLETKKNSNDYLEMLEVSVNIKDDIENEEEEQKKLEEQRKQEEKEAKHIDSLKTAWDEAAKKLRVSIDSISEFNKSNIAIYKKDDAYGIIDDIGNIILKANNYKYVISYDNYFLMLNKKNKPTKIYCYNINDREGFLLPSIEIFNIGSTNYGKVMLPRGNGHLVTYPNNSRKAFIYDLSKKEFIIIKEEKELLKKLRKNGIIDKYNKVGQIKIGKIRAYLGGYLGGGIYALYKEENNISGFLNSSNGTILSINYYNYLGAFYNGNYEIIEKDKTFWMDDEGIRQEVNIDESGKYTGLSKFIKLEESIYHIIQNINGQNTIVLGQEKLINQKAFIKKNTMRR